MNSITFTFHDFDQDTSVIRRVLEVAARQYGEDKHGDIALKLVDEGVIRELNRNFADTDAATDVLSFPYEETDKHEVSGDIAICGPVAHNQASAAGTSVENELALLALHGFLHLVGYDHQNKKTQATMDHIQRELLEKHGLTYRDFNWQD